MSFHELGHEFLKDRVSSGNARSAPAGEYGVTCQRAGPGLAEVPCRAPPRGSRDPVSWSNSGPLFHDGTGSRRQGRVEEGRPEGGEAYRKGEGNQERGWRTGRGVEVAVGPFGTEGVADGFVCLAFASRFRM